MLAISNIEDKEPTPERQYVDLEDFFWEIKKKIDVLEKKKKKTITPEGEENLTNRFNTSIHAYKSAITCATRLSKRGRLTS